MVVVVAGGTRKNRYEIVLSSCFHLFNEAVYKYDHSSKYASNVHGQTHHFIVLRVTPATAWTDLLQLLVFSLGKFAAGSKQPNCSFHSFILAPCAPIYLCRGVYWNLCKIIHLLMLRFSQFYFSAARTMLQHFCYRDREYSQMTNDLKICSGIRENIRNVHMIVMEVRWIARKKTEVKLEGAKKLWQRKSEGCLSTK